MMVAETSERKSESWSHDKHMGGNKEGEGQPREYTHQELVDEFRAYIQDKQRYDAERKYPETPPAEIIRLRLGYEESQSLHLITSKPTLQEQERNFFWQLRSAWDAVAYEHYKVGSGTEHGAGVALWWYHQQSGKSAISLSDPLQVRIIDALAEALGIPHTKGQTAIPIPEKLKDYPGYELSYEYFERKRNAREKKRP